MSVEIKTDEDVVTAFLSGEIDHHVALPIREKTDAAIISAHPKRVVLDFSGVTFMDSSGIAVALRGWQRMRELGGAVTLYHVAQQPRKVFEASGVGRMVTIV